MPDTIPSEELSLADVFQTPIAPLSVRRRVSDSIREAIFAGKLVPGQRIVELQLAKQLGVGTTSVREALFELEAQGFVTRITNKGVYVTKLSAEDIDQLYRVRLELEGLAVELATEQLDTAGLAALEEMLARMKADAEEGKSHAFFQETLGYHRALWQASGNRYLTSFLESLVVPLFAFFLMRVKTSAPEDQRAIWKRHQQVLRAIQSKNHRKARVVMEEALRYFWQIDQRLLAGRREKP